jgi:exodeoxyribonuclease VII large subunit
MISAPELPGFSRFWSVSEVNTYLKTLMEADSNLQDLWVEGEISNLARPASGHLYFTLKDQNSSLRCVMWKNHAAAVGTLLQEGAAVEAHGNLNVYEQRGQYQLYIDFLRPRGEGKLFQEYQRLKAQLEGEGLFDPGRKKTLPAWPTRIGIVTSATGAAFQDMKDTLKRRYPLVKILLAPTSVQGENAPLEIVAALNRLYVLKPDLILIGRGGGSIEDLWAFNDERVARAIFESPVPVISGVGHETDFTISDFVADLRRIFSEQRWILENLAGQITRLSPLGEINSGRQRLDELSSRLERAGAGYLKEARGKCNSLQARLSALNPESILKRGYAVLTTDDGSTVYQVGQVSSGEHLQVRVSDGEFEVNVK